MPQWADEANSDSLRIIEKRTGAGALRLPCVKGAGKNLRFLTEGLSNRALLRAPRKVGVLIPSVMALRETAMTAPLGQQGEPFPSPVTAAPCHPLLHKVGFALHRLCREKVFKKQQCRIQPDSALYLYFFISFSRAASLTLVVSTSMAFSSSSTGGRLGAMRRLESVGSF